MILENELERPAPSRGFAASEFMRLFFQTWIENEQVVQRWREDKARATRNLEQYLETYAVVLAEKNSPGKQAWSDWLEQSMNKLEALEKLQLKQCFVVARVAHRYTGEENKETQPWVNTENEWLIHIESFDPENTKVLVFMPDPSESAYSGINITDIFRQGLTHARAFLNIINLSEIADIDWICSRLEVQLQIFKNHIHAAYELQRNSAYGLRKNRALKDALSAYDTLLLKLSKMLVEGGIYRRAKYARQGIIYMAEFLWAQNFECTSIHVQHASKNRANIMVFEPKFVKGSGNKEASWVKKLSGTHPWIKNLPWQVLQKPRSFMSRDSEGLKLEKVTLALIKKEAATQYAVDCIPIGELGGISVPLAMDNWVERYKVTVANQRGIYLGSQTYSDDPPFTKLEETICAQVTLLTPIFTTERRKQGITIALADISLSQAIFPYATSAGWLRDVACANEEIRAVLNRYAIYYNEPRSTHAYLDRTSSNFIASKEKIAANEDYIPIHIEFYGPTMSYDYLRSFPCKTKHDMHSLKSALQIAFERLEIFKEKLLLLAVDYQCYREDIRNIEAVQTFLQSSSIGFSKQKKIPNDVIKAARALSKKLRNTEYLLEQNSYGRRTQIELLKILQSSLIVKTESFQTTIGFLCKAIENYLIGPLLIRPSSDNFKRALIADTQISSIVHSLFCILTAPFFMAGWAIRFGMLLSAIGINIWQAILHVGQKMFGIERKRTDYLAPAVSILFSAIGKKKLNSKHMVDRALSVLLTSSRMIAHATNSDLVGDKTPLMSDLDQYIPQSVAADERIMSQQLFKATGSKSLFKIC